MATQLRNLVRRLFTTPYKPDPAQRDFLARAETQTGPVADVTVAILDVKESEHFFGARLARRGIQPVYLRIVNRSATSIRLQLVSIDPNYYTPLEAAALNHFSIVKRLSAFGILGWWFFLPLFVVLPFKLITAYRANRRMDQFFSEQAFHLRPIPPGGSAEGFVFTPFDAGTKVVHVRLHAIGDSLESVVTNVEAAERRERAGTHLENDASGGQPAAEFTFTISVPGIAADYLRRDFDALTPPASLVACDIRTLVARLCAMPPATTNSKAVRTGDPVNLVVIGNFDAILGAFAARWDESESITLDTCWKTFRAFLLGSDYRYSPVSPLHLFGRSQDVALQRTRGSINERLHLRLWLTPLRLDSKAVWVGQVSRDIGVRFTTRAWNLTTHRIDPDVDEARDYVLEDLLQAGRIEAAGYVDGVGDCTATTPRRNLTGDPYYTDGKRVVILLSSSRTTPRFMSWG